MTDLQEAHTYKTLLSEQLEKNLTNEGDFCTTFEQVVELFDKGSSSFIMASKTIGRGVFRGEIPDNEKIQAFARGLKNDLGETMLKLGYQILQYAESSDIKELAPEAHTRFVGTLAALEQYLKNWLPPKLSINPTARLVRQLSEEQVAKARAQLESLPFIPLPK
ncbi:MAG: hypothetical protein ACRC8S_02500 [Fimbriiglobus sp.]